MTSENLCEPRPILAPLGEILCEPRRLWRHGSRAPVRLLRHWFVSYCPNCPPKNRQSYPM